MADLKVTHPSYIKWKLILVLVENNISCYSIRTYRLSFFIRDDLCSLTANIDITAIVQGGMLCSPDGQPMLEWQTGFITAIVNLLVTY